MWFNCIVQVEFFVYETNVKLAQELLFSRQDKITSSHSLLVQLSDIGHVRLHLKRFGKTILESQGVGIGRTIHHYVVEIFKAFEGYFDWFLVVVFLRKMVEMPIRKRSRLYFRLNLHSPRIMNDLALLTRFPIHHERGLLSLLQQGNCGKRRNNMKLSLNRHSDDSLTGQGMHLDQDNTTNTGIQVNQLYVFSHFVGIDPLEFIEAVLFL